MPLLCTLIVGILLHGSCDLACGTQGPEHSAPQVWKPYEIGRGFQLRLPSPPKESSSQKLGPGSKVLTCLTTARTVVVVGVGPLNKKAAAAPDEALARGIDGQVAGSHGALMSERDVLFKGWPGVEIRTGAKGGLFAITRAFAVRGSLVELTVIGDTLASLVAPAQKLFESLRVSPSIGHGPLRFAGPTYTRYAVGDFASAEFPSEPTPEKVELQDSVIGSTLIRYVSRYRNRVFVAAYVDLPKGRMSLRGVAQEHQLLGQMNDAAMSSVGVSNHSTRPATLGGGRALLSAGTCENGNEYVRAVSAICGTRMYTFLVLVPDVMRDALEVQRFTNSALLFQAPKAS